MHKKNRICAALPAACIMLAVLCFLLGGCVKKHSRGDIASYARKITGHRKMTVSDQYEEIQEDEEGYLDHLWTVTDEETGVTFHVLDDYYWSLEEVENRILDDHDCSAFLHLLEQGAFPQTQKLSLKRTDYSGLVQAEIVCGFSDSAGLRTCYEELLSLRQAAEEAGFTALQVPCTVQYQNPLRDAVSEPVDEGDTSGVLGDIDETVFERMRRNYLSCALDYRFEEALEEFTQEEITQLIHSPETVRIYRVPEGEETAERPETDSTSESARAEEAAADPEDREYYEGVIGSPEYAGISFGTLYELLRMEGMQPEGNAWHFSLAAPDGSRLEFSYDFHDLSGFNDAQGKLQTGYYYICDDKKVRMNSYYANHFEASAVNALTGLRIAEDRPYLTDNSGK